MPWSDETKEALSHCEMCPRKCGADRLHGAHGACGAGLNLKTARAAALFCEEPCFSGASGSGAVFLSGCPVRCIFCQNSDISFGNYGEETDFDSSCEMIENLLSSGVVNLNFVSPTQYSFQIRDILAALKPGVPVIWNTGGYESVDTLKKLEPYIDIYLADFKFDKANETLCGAPSYYDRVLEAIPEMVRQKGNLVCDENGLAVKGVLIRHLVLPGRTKMTANIFNALSEQIPTEIPVSLMSQYFPTYRAKVWKGMDRKITEREYDRALGYLLQSGFKNGYAQDLSSAVESYVPDFDLTGIPKK